MKTAVAIIEPNEQYRKTLEAFLIQNDYDVILSFDSGENIVKKLYELGYAPEIFIIDVNVYDMNGAYAAQDIKRELPFIKIVLYCNDLHDKVYSKFSDDNETAHYFVDKGAKPEILLRTLDFCVRQLVDCTPYKHNKPTKN